MEYTPRTRVIKAARELLINWATIILLLLSIMPFDTKIPAKRLAVVVIKGENSASIITVLKSSLPKDSETFGQWSFERVIKAVLSRYSLHWRSLALPGKWR